MINNINKHIWLIDLVANSRGLTFPEVDAAWQRCGLNPTGEPLPRRTFNNWRRDAYLEFSIDIRCDRHSNCYYIDRVEDMRSGKTRDWLLSALTISNLLNESDLLKGRLLLEDVPSGQTFLKALVEALKANVRVRLVYCKFRSGDTQNVTFEPYCLKLYDRRWYVMGRNVEKAAWRTYALDRIQAIDVTEEAFRLPPAFDAEEYYADCVGVMHEDDKPPVCVRLRVESTQCDYVRSLPLHWTQKEVLTQETYSEFTLFVRPTFDFVQRILGLREFVEVMEPATLRRQIKDIVEKMGRIYDK